MKFSKSRKKNKKENVIRIVLLLLIRRGIKLKRFWDLSCITDIQRLDAKFLLVKRLLPALWRLTAMMEGRR